MRLLAIVVHLSILRLHATIAQETGYEEKVAVEGTPEYAAEHYLKKIFVKYGVDPKVSNEMGEAVLTELMENLGLGVIHKIPTTVEGGDHENHDHDEHRRKKRGSEKPRSVDKYVDSASSIPHTHENITGNGNTTDCRSASRLLKEYKLDKKVTQDAGIGSYEFRILCPALIYLTDGKACIEDQLVVKEPVDIAAVWGYGFLSITLISLLSFLGALIVPFVSASSFEAILPVMVAGAVGALCGDALLHLIPHSQATSHSHSKDAVYKNLVVLLGIYLLFVIEAIMKMSHLRKENKQRSKKNKTTKADPPCSGSRENIDRKNSNDDFVYVGVCDSEKHEAKEEESVSEHKGHGHAHDHGDIAEKGIASMAWMVIAGDGMHNFSDGVAIGAAFSANIVGGLSTSIAVFCHELPHELGDFAMLVKAGMTVKQALFYNGFAACFGYLGLILGILIGNYAENVTPWVFAITAGMFLYVALVDMLPELSSCMTKMKTKSVVATFLLQNLGLLVGMSIMLLISLFEDNMEFGG